jgi:WD40 repeat protein
VCRYAFKEKGSSCYGLTVVDNAHFVAVVSSDTTHNYRMCMFSCTNKELVLEWQRNGSGYRSKSSTLYEDTYILVGSQGSANVDLWNITERSIEKQYKKDNDTAHCTCAMVGTEREYIVSGDGNSLAVWKRAKGTRTLIKTKHTQSINTVAVHPTHPLQFATCGYDRQFTIWTVDTEIKAAGQFLFKTLANALNVRVGLYASWKCRRARKIRVRRPCTTR